MTVEEALLKLMIHPDTHLWVGIGDSNSAYIYYNKEEIAYMRITNSATMNGCMWVAGFPKEALDRISYERIFYTVFLHYRSLQKPEFKNDSKDAQIVFQLLGQ